MHSLDSLQCVLQDRVEREAAEIGATAPLNLYQPIQYALDMGGKRLRPVMVLMACDLFGGNIDDALDAALAVEIFHNFTLLHDDIMDKAEMRRSRASVYKKYNENIAILSGDAMSIMAYRYLLKTKSERLPEIMSLFTETAIEVCEGQQYDMDFESRDDVSIDDYLEMIRLKTAVLIACSLKMGALLGKARAEDAELIYRFGINLGLAFQLQDDLLDVFADQEKFGKKLGGDIVANKKTFLLLKTLELASDAQRQELNGWLAKTGFDPDAKINAVREIYCEVGVAQTTREKIEVYYRAAMHDLAAMSVDETKKTPLLLLARSIMQRER